MQYEWILDVLTDLRAFAASNGLAELAAQLDDTTIVAASEIANCTGELGGGRAADADAVGALYRMPGTSDYT
ncbi:MAG: hypothetical protein KDE08_15075 [Rhodobacteraceae bacterium]|nr:hypothetical protein [Paracoccaceae bacterium]